MSRRLRTAVVAAIILLAPLAPAKAQGIGGNVSLAVTPVSANVAFPNLTVSIGGGLQFPSVILAPAPGSIAEIFYALGGASVAATLPSLPGTQGSAALPAGGICLNIGSNTNLAAIVAGGSTATLRITQVSGCTEFFGGANNGYVAEPQDTPNSQAISTVQLPSAAAIAGLTSAQTPAAATNLTVSGAHNLYGLQLTQTAQASWLMIFDAASLPANGAVTPKKCIALPATSLGGSMRFGIPLGFLTGMVVGLSSTGCYTLTAINASFIGIDYR